MNRFTNMQAIGFSIAGYALWVMSDTCMKLAGEAALPPYEVVGFLGFFSALMLLAWAAPKGGVKKLWPKNPRHQFGRAVLCICTNILNVVALNHLPLTLFYVSVFTAPMMIALLAALFGHERLNTGKILAVVLGFAGVVIAVNPFQDISHGDWIGYIAATVGTLSWALNATWLRVMTQSESGESLIFFTAFSEVIFGLVCMLAGHWDPITLHLVLLLAGMSALCVLGNFAIYGAFKYTTSTNVAQFHYTQIVTGALFGYLIWNEVPTLHLLMGILLITGAGLYIAHHARKAELALATQP